MSSRYTELRWDTYLVIQILTNCDERHRTAPGFRAINSGKGLGRSMPGVLSWRQAGGVRTRGCSLCGWISPVASEEIVPALDRSRVLQQIKIAFRAHNCADYPRDSAFHIWDEHERQSNLDREERHWFTAPPLDRTVLGTASGYWLVKVISAECTPPGNLLLSLI